MIAALLLAVGLTADAKAIPALADFQPEIDAVHASGGGRVTVPPGEYRIRPLELKSGVELVLSPGARLYASTNWSDYAALPEPALVWATNAAKVKVSGGLIYGEGSHFPFGILAPCRPRLVIFRGCRGVLVEDVHLRDPSRWTLMFDRCRDVTVRRARIHAHVNWNNDGIDVCDTTGVLIEDCDIDADDDAIVFKTRDAAGVCGDAEVRNCRLSSSCNPLKCGTESKGTFRNIRLHHCRIDARTPCVAWNFRRVWDKAETDDFGLSAIALEVVDGGRLENVHVHDIEVSRAVLTPIFIRFGRRNRRTGEGASYLRDVLIENVVCDAVSPLASSITGVPEEADAPALRPEDITIRNCTFSAPGGPSCSEPPPEVPGKYPECIMFHSYLPAHGFYVRHADDVRISNVRFAPRTPDPRPPCVFEDCRRSAFGARCGDLPAEICEKESTEGDW